MVNKMGDAVGDNPRLPAARPGDDKQRTVHRFHGLALGGIESLEKVRLHSHGAIIAWRPRQTPLEFSPE